MCPIKRNFITKWAKILETGKHSEVHKQGFPIFEMGKPISGMYIVKEGLVKEYVTKGDGKFAIIRFVSIGNVLGSLGFEKEKYSLSATAQEDSVICFIDNNALYDLYLSNSKLIFDLMLYFSNEYNRTSIRLKLISQMNLREKIAEALLYIISNFEENIGNNVINNFNREDIANLVCTTPEQVSRQLSDFEREKLIEKHGRKIQIVDVPKLKSIIENI